jgi:hypothetical protein
VCPFRALLMPALLAALACTEQQPDSAAVRDSAGVRIVTVGLEACDARSRSVQSRSRLRIGEAEGPEHLLFSGIGGAARLSDRRIGVTDRGSSSLRFFDDNGRYIASAGRRGSGPGEFHQFSPLTLWVTPTGTLVVHDGGNGRVNVFDSEGSFSRSITYVSPGTGGLSRFVGALSDSAWVIARGRRSLDGNAGELLRDSLQLEAHFLGADSAVTLTRAEGRPRYVHEFREVRHYPFLPFTVDPDIETHGGRLLLLHADRAEVEIWRLDGGAPSYAESWRLTGDRTRVRERWDAYVRQSLASINTPSDRELYAHYFGLALPLPEFLPLAEEILSENGGNVWVRTAAAGPDEESCWKVLTPEGRLVHAVLLPPAFRLLHAARDEILGVERDDLGIERLVVYALDR